jgi:hypothetical protein
MSGDHNEKATCSNSAAQEKENADKKMQYKKKQK